MTPGFVPPPYPYDRLAGLVEAASALPGGAVDCSIGTPCDPPPPAVIEALGASGAERGYPPSIGSAAYREAAAGWMARRHGVEVAPSAVAACVGTKEFVASAPQYLRLRTPDRDTVLHPAIAYPTYAMGATLAGCRPVAYDDLAGIDPADAARAVALWVNSPANPHGALEDLGAAADWGREHGVPVLSDECYVEFTWADGGRRRTILEHGPDGVLAVHSLSKRSNLAGARAGCYAGDQELVTFLGEVRKHAGQMVPGPVQAAAVVAWSDDAHVDAQREVYRRRMERLRQILAEERITFQRTKTWKESPDPLRDTKLARIEWLLEHERGRTFAFDEFGPLTIRPVGGWCWAPENKPERLRANYHKPHGSRQLYACYSIGGDHLWGNLEPAKSARATLRAIQTIRARLDDGKPVHVILDNLNHHKSRVVRDWCDDNDVELVFTPTYASWANPIEAHFGPLRQFAIANSDYPDHPALARAIRSYLRWRNTHTRDPEILEAERRHRAKLRGEAQRRWGQPPRRAA
jgi:aspartate/methionine/tyrosine aminotransferase